MPSSSHTRTKSWAARDNWRRCADCCRIDESIVIVGVCGSGKSTLTRALQALGYPARVCVQEHSYVPTLWLRRGRPRLLVYLEASLETVCQRRGVRWNQEVLAPQRERLASALAHADLCIDTNALSAEEVCRRVVCYMRERRLFGALAGGLGPCSSCSR